MSNAKHFIHNPLSLSRDKVKYAVDVEIRDCECNRYPMTILLDRDDWFLDWLEEQLDPTWSIRAWSDSYPFTWDYPSNQPS